MNHGKPEASQTGEIAAPCQLLAWDSTFFQKRIARVTGQLRTSAEAALVMSWAKHNAVDCLYYLAEASCPSTARIAVGAGFLPVDVQLTLEHTPILESPELVAGNGIRTADSHDLARLRQIASRCHQDSRFYFDGNFPRESCDSLFATWIEQSLCHGFADVVLIADTGQGPAGYVTCRKFANGVGSIGLFAVAEESRRQGHGNRLVSAALQWIATTGVKRATVVTQGRNVAAQRLYQRHGFLTSDIKLWFHAWPLLLQTPSSIRG